MKFPNSYYTVLLFFILSSSMYSQINENITYQDYNNHIYRIDRSMIERFGSQRNQMVVKIYNGGNRQYLVTYMDIFTQKMTEGPYDGNQHRVVSFENFKIEELERRKRREKERLEEIELERKKEEERKRKIKEEKIRKEKEKILNKRSKVLTLYPRTFDEYFFFKNKETPKNFYKNFTLRFNVNDDFLKKDVVTTDQIENIGFLKLSLRNGDPIFNIKIGVKNFFDDKNIVYYINDKEIRYDLGLKDGKWTKIDYKSSQHLQKNFFISDDKLFLDKTFSEEFNFPLPVTYKRSFNSFHELVLNFNYLKYLNNNRFKGNNRISKIINYIIVEDIVSKNSFYNSRSESETKNLNISTNKKGKWIYVEILKNNGFKIFKRKFRIHSKKWWVDVYNGSRYYRFLNPTDNLKTEFDELMNY